MPVASRSAAALANEGPAGPASLHDQRDFAAQAVDDAFRDTPGDELLTGLRGKDVLLTFVESYGRSAVEDPRFAPASAPARRRDGPAARVGFGARSGYLTSSTVGGGSWLAHSTLLVRAVDRQPAAVPQPGDQRPADAHGAFRKAGWETGRRRAGDHRGLAGGQVLRVRQYYDGPNLGYQGPRFSYATMPDQYLSRRSSA